MTSYIISNNNKLLLLPSLKQETEYDKRNQSPSLEATNLTLKELLRTDLTMLYRLPSLEQQPQTQEKIRLSSISSSSSIDSEESLFSLSSGDSSTSFSSVNTINEEIQRKESPIRRWLTESSTQFSVAQADSQQDINNVSSDGMKMSVEEPQIQNELPDKKSVTEVLHTQTPIKSKRQRVGPSCDACRFKKIKCDAIIETVKTDVSREDIELDKHNKVTSSSYINKYLSEDEINGGFELIFSYDKILKFKECTYCEGKDHGCHFHRGYTKEDIWNYNSLHNIKKKKRTRYRKKY